ncbi:MAG: zinc-ribbon domain-containing protein [Oscillospiraceae bacterium]|nr:zinc-ribbon domain-containing protein [Oscillospiraceae bacterium]
MYCPKCGSQIPENDRFCPTCGDPVLGRSFPDESDHTADFVKEDIERTNILSALCYLYFVFIIIALLLEPNSKFLRYHINQSIILTVFGILCGLAAIVPIIGWIVASVGSIACLVFTVMGIVNAYKGKAKDLPLIGKYSIIKYD